MVTNPCTLSCAAIQTNIARGHTATPRDVTTSVCRRGAERWESCGKVVLCIVRGKRHARQAKWKALAEHERVTCSVKLERGLEKAAVELQRLPGPRAELV